MSHRHVNAPGMTAPRGYSDATLVAPGHSLLFLGGHVAFDENRRIVHENDLVLQVRQILQNLRATLSAAGATPEHLVKLTIHTLDVPAWHRESKAIGTVWRETLGKVYPAATLLGVAALYDTGALVEIDGVAAIPMRP